MKFTKAGGSMVALVALSILSLLGNAAATCPSNSSMPLSIDDLQTRTALPTFTFALEAPASSAMYVYISKANQQFIIELDSSGSIGYSWKLTNDLQLPQPSSSMVLHPIGCLSYSASPCLGCVGSPTYEYWMFDAGQTSSVTELTLEYNYRGEVSRLNMVIEVMPPSPVSITSTSPVSPTPSSSSIQQQAACTYSASLPICTSTGVNTCVYSCQGVATSSSSNLSTAALVGLIVGCVAAVTLFTVFVCLFAFRRRRLAKQAEAAAAASETSSAPTGIETQQADLPAYGRLQR